MSRTESASALARLSDVQQMLWASGVSGALYLVVAMSERAVLSHAHRRLGLAAYALAVVGLFAAYGVAVHASGRLRSRAAAALAFGMPLAFQVFWIFVPPLLSIDLFSYVADGYLWRVGLNPYLHPVKEIGTTHYAAALAVYGWRPVHGVSPYGPLWMLIEVAVGRAHLSVAATILMLKAVVVSANALSAATIYAMLGRVGRRARLAGMTLYWWNPTIITEFAGDGHNDALMILAMLLGLWWIIRGRFVRGAVGLAAGALLKYLPGLVGAPALLYFWRTSDRARVVRTVVVAAPVVGIVAAAAYAPLW